MIDTLRPSTLGEILDRTAQIYRTRFLVFLGIAAMPAGVILGTAVVFGLFFMWVGTRGQTAGPEVVGLVGIVFLLAASVIFLPLYVGAAGLGTGALTHAAAAAFEHQNVTIRGAYTAAWKRGWRYIGLLALEGLILIVAPGIVWSILIVALAMGTLVAGKPSADPDVTGGILMVLGLAAMGLYALLMLLMVCLSFPACVVENVSAGIALKRAFSLSKGTRGRILALYLLGWLFRWGVSLALVIPIIVIVALIPGLDTPQHARIVGSVMVVVIYGGGFLVRAVTKPVYTIAQVLFYYDQRIRKEGFDIEWLMRQAGMVQGAAPEAIPWMAAVRPNVASPAGPPEPAPVRAQEAADSTPAAEPAPAAASEPIPQDALQATPGDPA